MTSTQRRSVARRLRARPALGLAFALGLALVPSALAAQGAGTRKAEAELGGSMFFGNTSALTLTARSAASMADSTRELALDGAYTYGEATDPDGVEFVSKRSWGVGLTLDYRPFARVSPFVLGRLESSFEQRIDRRYNLGAGAKLRLIESGASSADLSWAILADRTLPRGEDEAETLARWSGRLRARHALAGDRVTLTSETSWKPRVDGMSDYTIASANSVAFVLSDRMSLKLSFVDTYDSMAETRGARSNNDGQLLLTVLSAL